MRFLLFLIACSSEPAPRDEGARFRYFLVSSAGGGLQPGFGVALAEEREGAIRTRSGRVIARDAVEEAHPPRALGTTQPGIAWVIEKQAAVWSRPDDSEPPIARRSLFERVTLDEGEAPYGWRKTRDGYMRASELRGPTPASRPVEAAPGERWIDVDTNTQILTVYEGEHARFHTLISTGQGRPGTRRSTPRGVFHINYKAPSATMDNLSDEPAYSFEEVPWVQYFHKEVALHGAYWHQRFGHPVSHGCVNLTPADAERVYAWTRASTPDYAGTIVRVR